MNHRFRDYNSNISHSSIISEILIEVEPSPTPVDIILLDDPLWSPLIVSMFSLLDRGWIDGHVFVGLTSHASPT